MRSGLISCKQNTPLIGRKMAYQQLENRNEKQADRYSNEPIRHLRSLIGRINQPGHLREDLYVLVIVGGFQNLAELSVQQVFGTLSLNLAPLLLVPKAPLFGHLVFPVRAH